MVRQKPQTGLKREELARETEVRALGGVQHRAGGFKIAVHQRAEIRQHHMHLRSVRVVLRRGTRRRPHHVAEIVEREPGHDGVEIDDGGATPGHVIEHDIVNLGVVVRNALGELAAREEIEEHVGVGLPSIGKINLGAHALRPALGVFIDRATQRLKAGAGVMEIWDRVVQPSTR